MLGFALLIPQLNSTASSSSFCNPTHSARTGKLVRTKVTRAGGRVEIGPSGVGVDAWISHGGTSGKGLENLQQLVALAILDCERGCGWVRGKWVGCTHATDYVGQE